MRSPRETCEFKDRCGATGHLRQADGTYARCQCLTLEINHRKLGAFYVTNPKANTALSSVQDIDVVIEGHLAGIKEHVARVLLDRANAQQGWTTIDAYRLIEIFLGEDKEFDTQSPITESDLLIILLGFGDPRNRYLPELLIQVLSRRELTNKPTWIILGTTIEQTGSRYSSEVQERLKRMKKVNVR